jgi:hypothetical protein
VAARRGRAPAGLAAGRGAPAVEDDLDRVGVRLPLTGSSRVKVGGRYARARWRAELCVHGAHVHGGGLEAQGVAIIPAHQLRSARGDDRVVSDVKVALLATTARTSLRPAAWPCHGATTTGPRSSADQWRDADIDRFRDVSYLRPVQ